MQGQRKKVFGNKKKKEQLKQKRALNRKLEGMDINERQEAKRTEKKKQKQIQKDKNKKNPNKPNDNNQKKSNKPEYMKDLRTVFEREPQEMVEKRKNDAKLPIEVMSTDKARIHIPIYQDIIYMPVRPQWKYGMEKGLLEKNENKMFKSYLTEVYKKYGRERLNYFEHNLEVWRQLWRTTEISDILLVIVDSRYPLFHFNPSLYDYITRVLKKPMILVFNKIDLIPTSVLEKWKDYFAKRFPLIKVIDFSVYPDNITDLKDIDEKQEAKIHRKEWKTRTRKYSSPQFSSILIKRCLQELGRLDLFDENDEKELLQQSEKNKEETEDNDEDVSQETDEDEQDEKTSTSSNKNNKQEEDNVEEDSDEGYYNTKEKRRQNKKNNKNNNKKKIARDDDEDDEGDDDDEDNVRNNKKKNNNKNNNKNTNNKISNNNKKPNTAQKEPEAPHLDHKHLEKQEEEQLKLNLKDKPFITIGLVGHPNAGKSSIINCLATKKVVSVSATPGHTKHFQTIFIRKGVRLCDSPGLVFPSCDVPKELQILCGLYPIAQVRECYSSIAFLHKRIRVDHVYSLKYPYDLDDDEKFVEVKNHPWSAWELCEAYACFRGYRTAKGGKLDVYRGGKEILKEVVNGVIRLYFHPPNPELEEEEEKTGKRQNILHAAKQSQVFWNNLLQEQQHKSHKKEVDEDEEGDNQDSQEEEHYSHDEEEGYDEEEEEDTN